MLLINKYMRIEENCVDSELRLVKSRIFVKMEDRIVIFERDRDKFIEELKR